jgi:uncharacterized protein
MPCTTSGASAPTAWYGRGAGGAGRLAAGQRRTGTAALLAGTARLQLLLAGVAALFLLLFGLNRLGAAARARLAVRGIDPRRLPGFGCRAAGKVAAPRPIGRRCCFAGLMLGLLPCGLSYAAFARSLAAGGFLSGGLMCLVFGLGTLPGLLILGSGLGALIRRFRQQTEMIAGLIMIAMALFLAVDIWAALTNRP